MTSTPTTLPATGQAPTIDLTPPPADANQDAIDAWAQRILDALNTHPRHDDCTCSENWQPDPGATLVHAAKDERLDLWSIQADWDDPWTGTYLCALLEIDDAATGADVAVDSRTRTIWVGDLTTGLNDPTSPAFARAWRDRWRSIARTDVEHRNSPRVDPRTVETFLAGDVEVTTTGFIYPCGGHYLDFTEQQDALAAVMPDHDLVAITPWFTNETDTDDKPVPHEGAFRVTWARAVPTAEAIADLPDRHRLIALDATGHGADWTDVPVAIYLAADNSLCGGTVFVVIEDHRDDAVLLASCTAEDDTEVTSQWYAVGDTFTCAGRSFTVTHIAPTADLPTTGQAVGVRLAHA
jgi:hypothetical protein